MKVKETKEFLSNLLNQLSDIDDDVNFRMTACDEYEYSGFNIDLSKFKLGNVRN